MPLEAVRLPRLFGTLVCTEDSYPPIDDGGAPVGLGLVPLALPFAFMIVFVAAGETDGSGAGGGPGGGGLDD